VEFANADKTLKPEQLQMAASLAVKFPAIVSESVALRSEFAQVDAQLQRAGQRYYGFCSELRRAKLNRRESTLLLKALGYVKTRISEILKVSEVSDEIWAKYSNGQIGFKAALALERGTDDDDDGGEGEGESEGDTEKKTKKKEKRLPKEFQPSIVACLEDWGDSLKACGQKEPYVMRYENKDKRTFVVTIQPIDATS